VFTTRRYTNTRLPYLTLPYPKLLLASFFLYFKQRMFRWMWRKRPGGECPDSGWK